MHALPVAASQEGEQVNSEEFQEELYISNLERMASDYRKRYNNGIITSIELQRALLAIQRESERRKKGRRW